MALIIVDSVGNLYGGANGTFAGDIVLSNDSTRTATVKGITFTDNGPALILDYIDEFGNLQEINDMPANFQVQSHADGSPLVNSGLGGTPNPDANTQGYLS